MQQTGYNNYNRWIIRNERDRNASGCTAC